MSFIKLSIQTSSEFSEIYIAELAEIGFDTFEETDSGLDAYIPKNHFDIQLVEGVFSKYKAVSPVKFSTEEIQKQNWNKDWEKNYDPIEVEGKCRVRATFHDPDASFEYEIIVIPKMSFGTGHHATTYNMLKLEMEHDFTEKSVLDIGTGTGILAIMAKKLGAAHIEGTDIDSWCIENSSENFGLNDIQNVAVHLGTIQNVKLQKNQYDIILANINKNVLLEEIKAYSGFLGKNGVLFLSGFYESDIDDIKNEALNHNLSIEISVIKDRWTALKLVKTG